MFSSFIGSVNRVTANFGHLQCHILSHSLRHTAAHFTDLRYCTLILKVLPKFVLLGIKVFALFSSFPLEHTLTLTKPFTEPAE